MSRFNYISVIMRDGTYGAYGIDHTTWRAYGKAKSGLSIRLLRKAHRIHAKLQKPISLHLGKHTLYIKYTRQITSAELDEWYEREHPHLVIAPEIKEIPPFPHVSVYYGKFIP